MAGATAASAAGVTASQAGLITVNLTHNFISATGGNHLNADLTGDGQADITIANAAFGVAYRTTSSGYRYIQTLQARVTLNGVLASAYVTHYPLVFLRIGSHFTGATNPAYFPTSLTGSIPITFKDLNINNGRLTHGSLNVTAFIEPRVQLDSFTYNTAPDQGSSLALLAMGAGGVLTLRRWRAARERQ